MDKKIVGIFVFMLVVASTLSVAKTANIPIFNITKEPLTYSDNQVTIYVNTSAIDARPDLTNAQKTALKNRILQHMRDNFEDAVGAGNVTVTNNPAQAGSANRTVQIEPGMDPTPPAGWGSWPHSSNTTTVYLGEFMNDSNVNSSFKNPDGSWNTTKLGNAIGHTAGHEVGHSYSIGHNHKERPKGRAEDNRSKMTVGKNINASERANASFKFDNHSKDVLKNNWGEGACDAVADYDEKVLLSHFWANPSFPDKFDETGTLDALFFRHIEMPGWYEFGFLGIDSDDGVVDGNPDFDFIYKSSLSMDDTDAEIISFLDDHHERTTWLLRGTEESPYPGEWFPLNPDNVFLEEWIEQPDGNLVARYATMIWPEQVVYITFDSYSFGHRSSSYNGFTYEYYTNIKPGAPTISGPTEGDVGTSYSYTFNAVDPDVDYIYYYIEWGDGEVEDWFGPYYSGYEVTVSHTWDEQGTYIIRAKARDTYGLESDWGELTVTMPRNRAMTNLLLLRLLEQFPILKILLLQR
jgi:hypothetical protein